MNAKTIDEIEIIFRRVLWGTNGEEFYKIAVAFILGGVAIAVGGYIRDYDLKKKVNTENRILGYLKLCGRTSLPELATKVGISQGEIVKVLSELRQRKDIVFHIDENEVYMPGYERERPTEKVTEKVTEKIVVKIPCPNCGTLNDPTTEKCTNCGAPIKGR
ncbi:MAG: zinc ribbon domain-containing protein [Candidatus Bathyarchaeota archaeon]|nr:zinc ribbon domain-containing protein [Candidatus Bathyarchaeota archaeon]